MRRLFMLAGIALATTFSATPAQAQLPALINMDLGYPDAVKTGPAAVGQGTNDFWNIGWYSPITNVKFANGAVSPVTISIVNGMFGSSCGSTDPMYNTYVFNNYYATSVSVIADNLIPGLYDFYAYSPDAGFNLTVGTNNLGSRACSDSPLTNPPVWEEGRQYVRYTNVLVGTGETVTLTAGGLGKISGWQIAAVAPALAMLEQPQSQTINAGENVVLTANAIGNPAPSYQWRLEGTNLPGATASSLTLTNVLFSQQGNYSVVVSNNLGAIYSSNAFLTVQAPPVIHEQPVSLVLGAGSDAVFHAVADGSPPLGYQWLFGGNALAGATESSLTISNTQAVNMGDYSVLITNAFGTNLSEIASLSVTGTAPVILSSPQSVTATRGAPVELRVAARGTDPLGYQWTRNGSDLPGQSQAAITFDAVQPGDAGTYRVLVTNLNGTAPSDPATLAVTPPPGFLWARQLAGVLDDEAKCTAVDAEGNVYVAGYFRGTTVVGATSLVSVGGQDIFLAKYDRLGQLLWARQAGSVGFYIFGDYNTDAALGLAIDAAGSAYITGSFTGNADFGGTTLSRGSGAGLFLAKYGPSGDLLWATQSSGSGMVQGNGLCLGPDGNVFVTGVFTGANTLGTNNLPLAAPGASNAVFVACFDADGRAVWAKRALGNGRSKGRAIALARDGTIYVAGDFSGIAYFDGVEVVDNAANEPGDIFVAAYESSGSVLWVTTAGGTYADSGAGVACDGAGNVYVTGSFKGVARFGGLTLNTGTAPEIFVAKYGHDGKLLWARSAGGGSSDYGNSIAVDCGGNACVAGTFSGSASFSGTNLSGFGWDDAFVAMYTTVGDLAWVRNAGGSGADTAASVCADAAGNVYLAGSSPGPATFGYATLPGVGSRDAFVAKLAATDPDRPPAITLQPASQTFGAGAFAALSVGFVGGPPLTFQWRLNGAELPGETNAVLTFGAVRPAQGGDYSLVISNASGAVTSAVAAVTVAVEPDYLWSRRAGGASNDEAAAVATDASGNVYAAGYFSGTADFSGTPLVSHGGEDIFVAKYDKTGALLWVSQAGGTGNDRATGLALDSGGTRVLIAGSFGGSVDFGVTNLTSAGNSDILLAQLNPLGNWVWASQAGGTLRDAALGVAVDDSGNAALTGYYQGTARFDGNTLSTGATNEIFVAKYNSSGRVLWARGAGASTGADTGRAIACDRKGHIYVAGSFFGSANFGGLNLNSAGDLGIFLAQYNSSNGNVVWARQAGASGQSDDEALALCADREGSALVSGYIQNQALFGSNLVATVSSNAPDLFLAKYDVDGNLAWVQQAGGIFNDYGNSLATDGCGNAYLAGAFAGKARFGDDTITSIGSSDFFVALYDGAGRLVKVRHGGGSASDAAQAVAADGKGGAVVAGYYGADAAIGGDLLSSAGGRDIFVSKLQLFPSNAAPSITTAPAEQTAFFGSNAVFMVGVSSGTALTYQWQFNGARIAYATNSILRVTNVQYANMGDYSVVVSNAFGVVTSAVARLTTDLFPEFVWLRSAGGAQDDSAQTIATDNAGNLFVAGYFKTSATFGPITVTNAGQEDVFLAKYDTNGAFVWVSTAGGVSGDYALGIAVDAAGNPVIAGTFSSARATFGPYTLTNAGSQDIFVAKYDSQGSILWAKQAGYLFPEEARAVAVDSAGNIYITGFARYISSIGGIWFTNTPGTNFLVAKYDPVGNVVWAKTAYGANTCVGTGITVDHDTNVLVTGYLLGRVDFGAGVIVNTNLTYYGGTVFLAKYDSDGDVKWSTKGIGGAVGYGQNIKTDAEGNIFATATRRDYAAYPLISKYDSTGKRLWTRGPWLSCCSFDFLTAEGLALDLDGNPYICGMVSGYAYFENYYYPITRQGYVAKYRGSDGALFWAQRLGQAGNGVVVDAANNTYLAGRFTGPGYFGPTNTLPSAGLSDAFVARIGVKGPEISASLADQYVVTGSNAVLNVAATGTGPLGYQWLFNGTAINGATGSSLSLANFLPGNAGAYSVVVRNTAGSVTSQPAQLTLIPVLQIGRAGEAVVLDWLGAFILQSATNAQGPYFDLQSGANSYTNDIVDPQRFFRLRSAQ